MDGIEELASGILRTSKLTIQGEPGGNDKVLVTISDKTERRRESEERKGACVCVCVCVCE